MSKVGDDRGEGTTPPEWWWKRFVEERARRPDEGLVWLGKHLATLVNRPQPWHHSIVGNFINHKKCTREMCEAFSLHYEIPRFEVVVHADTEEDANRLEMFLRRLGSNPAMSTRVSDTDAAAALLQAHARDQMRPVDSDHEATDRSRRSRRTPRRS